MGEAVGGHVELQHLEALVVHLLKNLIEFGLGDLHRECQKEDNGANCVMAHHVRIDFDILRVSLGPLFQEGHGELPETPIP